MRTSSASLEEEREREVDRIIREIQVLKFSNISYRHVHLSLLVSHSSQFQYSYDFTLRS